MSENGEFLYQSVAGPGEMLLDVRDLHTYFFLGPSAVLKAVNGVSFVVNRGHVLGIIGESGSGKSVTSRSILRVVDVPGRHRARPDILQG